MTQNLNTVQQRMIRPDRANPAKITSAQVSFIIRMEWELSILHNQWYGHDGAKVLKGGMDKAKFESVNRQVRLACERLKIPVSEAFDPDGWDGERYGPLVTLQDALGSIKEHFGYLRYHSF